MAYDSLDGMKHPWRTASVAAAALAVALAAFLTYDVGADLKRRTIVNLPVCNDSPSRNGRAYAVLDPQNKSDCGPFSAVPPLSGDGTDTPHICVCRGSDSTYVAFPGPPVPFAATRINRDTPQTIADSTPTFIIWDLESFDDDGWTDPGGANPTRLTVDFNGRALCGLNVVATAPPATENELCIEAFINGFNASPNPGCFSISNNEGNAANFTDLLPFSTSDFLEIRVTQDTGANIDIAATLWCQRTL